VTLLSRIGKYGQLERIGAGGSGVVYKGVDLETGRTVAVKVCTAADPEVRRGFEREAELSARLRHPCVVEVLGSGRTEDGPYVVQEYLPGEDLETKVARREPLLLERCMRILLNVARGLRYAHDEGVLHLGLSPGNVRVLLDGGVKVLDFGMGRSLDRGSRPAPSSSLVGTAGFLAPEQIRGSTVDARTDVFSFGVMAYELLTYTHPFPGERVEQVLEAVLSVEPAPVSRLWTEVPTELATLVSRCLEKDPARRPASFHEVEEVLGRLLGEEAVDRTSVERRHALSDTGVVAVPGARTVIWDPPPDLVEAAEESTTTVSSRTTVAPPAPPLPLAAKPPVAASAAPASGTVGGHPPGRVTAALPRPRRKGLTLGVAGALAVVVLVAAAVWLWRRPAAVAPPPPAPAPADRVAATATPAVPGRLLVEALPWGEIQRILGPDGEVAPPADPSTPALLELPQGSYRLQLGQPGGDRTAECEALVTSAGLGRCRVELFAVSAADYFREAGWWR
jgi:serine/threonine-protein kinase